VEYVGTYGEVDKHTTGMAHLRMLAHDGPEQRVPRPLGRTPNVELHVTRLEVCGSKH